MTAILTEVQKSDEMVKLAREQIDAFNQGDWELLRGIHTSDARYEEFGTERKVEVRRRSSSSSRAGRRRFRTSSAP